MFDKLLQMLSVYYEQIKPKPKPMLTWHERLLHSTYIVSGSRSLTINHTSFCSDLTIIFLV